MRRLAVALAAALLSATAAGHDTWFVDQGRSERGERLLALGSGNAYPVMETAVPVQQLEQSGCLVAGGRRESLRWVMDAPQALVMRTARPVAATAGVNCWAQLAGIDIELDDAIVEPYLDEVQAPASVRERWAAQKARGLRWRERYVKHLRIDLDGEGAAALAAAAVDGLGMDVRLEAARPLRAGQPLRLQVLRGGRPVPGLAVELRHSDGAPGLWRRTDGAGQLEIALPDAGRWVLRATQLQPSASDPDRWESAFVTLAFAVQPR